MKCFCILDCDVLEQIQSEVLDYLKNNTSLLVEKPVTPWIYDNNTKQIIKNCPSLIKWLSKLRVLPTEITFVVCHDIGINLPIHTDDPRLISKINIPIQHTEGNVTRWHDADDNVIAEYNMAMPVVFNSSIPHSVEIFNQNLPRVVMAVMCNNEKRLLEFLQDE
jgi:hypothetical protein